MRTRNSIKNIYMSIITQIVIILLGFISRKVFINSLGTEYLGINGILTNVLSMLALVEGGIGGSIVYNLYKPLAEDDTKKVIALVQLYKKLYGILAIVILILSFATYPLVNKVINQGGSIPYIGIVYSIFVLKNMISYLNAHKWSLINADQKGYVLAKYNLAFNIITTLSKIIILQVTKNYILFLLVEILIFTIQNIYNGKIVNRKYPYIKTKQKYRVDNEIKNNLVTNVKALFLHNIGGYCVFGTDNLLIGALINVKTVGLYSTYTMITGQMSSLITPILNGIGASVGNLIATESEEKIYKIFNVIYLINFWIYSLGVIFLYNLLEPFIDWWFGKGLLLDNITFIIILINFYLTGLRACINTFKSKAGIFVADKYVPLIEAFINLSVSYVLAKYIGLVGIFIGTTISTITVPLWTQSKLVYNEVFNKSVVEYLKKYILYGVITVIACVITTNICEYIVIGNEFISLVVKGIISISIPNIIYVIIFYKTDEFKYLFNLLRNIANKKKEKMILE